MNNPILCVIYIFGCTNIFTPWDDYEITRRYRAANAFEYF